MVRLAKCILSIIFFFLVLSNANAQDRASGNPVIDSLRQVLRIVTGEERVDVLNQLAYNYYYYYVDSVGHFAQKAVKLADSINYKKGLSKAQMAMGISHALKNHDQEAIKWLFSGLETSRSINYHQGIADNLKSIAIFYNYIEYYHEAINFFRESLKYQLLADNPLREGVLYSNLGSVHLFLDNTDSAFYYFEKARNLLDSIGDDTTDAMILNDFGNYYMAIKEPDKAEEYIQQAIVVSEEKGQTLHLRNSYQVLAEIYNYRKQYNEARKFGEMALELSRQMDFVPYLIHTNKLLYEIHRAKNNYRTALDYLEKYTQYRDSLRNHQINTETSLLKYKRELKKREDENILLKKESELQNQASRAAIRQQTIIVIAISIILMLVSALAFIFFKLRQKEKEANIQLSKSNKELENQKEQLSASLQMVEHLNAHLQAQNNTINKIAILSITDLQGNIISVNDNFCQVSGYSRDELIGRSHEVIRSDEHPKEMFEDLWKTITAGKTWRGEFKNKAKNGDYYWCDSAIAPIFDDEGRPKQFFSLQFEITARKNYLSDLVAKSKELEELNKLKDKLLSVVSHDFRSPLNSLRGMLTLFLKGAISPEEMHMLASDLVEKLDNTHNLLENLLNWAKSQMQGLSIYPKKINLRSLSEDTIELLTPMADKKYLKIKNHIDDEAYAFADNEMVKLVFRNLLSNAIKFSPSGEEIMLQAAKEGHKVTIAVIDNGAGISNEHQEKLFKQENVSTLGTDNERGMGIGLLLCKDFIEKNGGSIWFESELGNGSTFYFSLPEEEIKD